MFSYPVRYDEPLFRPPAEAYSAIIQATIGCSWNKCAFCEMYTTKKFRVRSFDDVKKDIISLADYYKSVRKIFLADGNAFVLSAAKLIPILQEIKKNFGQFQRVSAYALPKDIAAKTKEELTELKENGLKLLYIGIESGDDELLAFYNKGETFDSTIKGINKAHEAGIDTSIMIINGIGGKKYSEQHAINSAQIISILNPKYLSTLTLSYPYGINHFKSRVSFDFQPQTVVELLKELDLFISNIRGENIIFRSNHVSNSLALKGTLTKDSENIIRLIKQECSLIPDDEYPIETRSM